jgi:hypothetical protein
LQHKSTSSNAICNQMLAQLQWFMNSQTEHESCVRKNYEQYLGRPTGRGFSTLDLTLPLQKLRAHRHTHESRFGRDHACSRMLCEYAVCLLEALR